MRDYHKILNELDNIDRTIGFLTTEAESVIQWNSIPNQEILIIEERIKSIKNCMEDIFNIFEKY